MTVPADKFYKVQNADAMSIFAIIVDRYVRKMADDIATEVASGASRPVVQWPTF